ncbi:hypothetical protein A2926_00555 [Candidatus Giovannonibacteria bacterium RIFCSPLOWO2_01_FULL_44_40]|uniref:Type II secretion system protein J n=1 Tax=Candidatus Giovannonibacteria bacterium RIFCSPHIGHO2_01_FULL_45_23 TaxID=1798325 RepID=A0A1F5VET0_9BACT|nr:MAG: hypothetical protein A2834_00570 [Candidatus Giovannonibacteria bacterium RIFCSPHIGHO2_01_FULL_45_23]OGF76536.1 MAG: hypothetical protein A3C77_03280 [Candidatus Giovannonibacteria bacterium RIFCSPHIGHO2_02_FULL_45_13]OGF79802.1 MAG: hypothetical protein A2926_00555 [Candidatus Giovannonibacteria bacterium RIFCSPLOWO2_01_FULL_44_40]
MKGFTLLEMIVALGVFATVALISASSLLLLTDAQRKAFSLQSAYDNVRFSLEVMARDLRTGYSYYCGSDQNDIIQEPTSRDCPAGGPAISYKNFSGNTVNYRIFEGRIEKFVDGIFVGAMTSENIIVDTLTFYVVGSPSDDDWQPRVAIVIKGEAGSGRSMSKFNLQTTVSQRKINL